MIKDAKDVQKILHHFSENPSPKIQDSCVVCHLESEQTNL